MGGKATPRGYLYWAIRGMVTVMAAFVAMPVAAPVVPAQAQTPNSCLIVENNRSSATTSVTVVGFKETSSYWSFVAGESAVLNMNNSPIHASSFTIRVYDGDGINSSKQLEGSNKYVNWRYDTQRTDNGKCPDGGWVATLHD